MNSKKVLNNVNFDKLKELLEKVGGKMLFYHRDADGVCSAALILKFFPELEAIAREGPGMEESFINEIISKNPNLLVFVDMPIDQEWKKLLDLKKRLPNMEIVIIDHHTIEKNMNREDGFIHINPRFVDKLCYIPASCVTYKALEKMGYDVSHMKWISLAGIIGDYGFKDCMEMFTEDEKKGTAGFEKLSKISEVISSAITFKGTTGAKMALSGLISSQNYLDFSKSEELMKWNMLVQREIRKIVDDFEKNKEMFKKEKIIFYEIKNKMNITSVIATITAEKYPDYVIVIRKKSGNRWKFSFRCQTGGIDVGDMAKVCSKGMGSGGGHIKSAGAIADSWEVFRKNLFNYLK